MKKAIAMKCSQEDWDSIKPALEKSELRFNTVFKDFDLEYNYLTNFYRNEKNNLGWRNGDLFTVEEIHETFNAKIFLEACGIEFDKKIEITKEQLKSLIEAAVCNIKDYVMNNNGFIDDFIKDEFTDAFKKELEVGKWYKHNSGALALKTGDKSGYGFDYKMKFEFDVTNYSFHSHPNNWQEATPQEVEAALICEAKKRGYKENVLIKHILLDNTFFEKGRFLDTEIFIYDEEENSLDCKNKDGQQFRMFKDGIWATIIHPEKMTLEQIEKELGRKIEIV